MKRRNGFFARSRRWLRWSVRILLILLVLDLAYLATIWPDWKKVSSGPVPKSNFMKRYEEKAASRHWPPIVWQPVSISRIPRHMIRAVIVAEDSRFYSHSGFDLIAIKEAIDLNLEKGKLVFGASTISQQTVKNLYLSSSRDPLRKWHEMFLTWGLEHNLRKSRILELYLNIVEFGHSIYGVQAAARHYYGVNAEDLTLMQAAELAATLPSPGKHNPATRTESFERRTQRIYGLLTREQSRPPGTPAVPVPPGQPADSSSL